MTSIIWFPSLSLVACENGFPERFHTKAGCRFKLVSTLSIFRSENFPSANNVGVTKLISTPADSVVGLPTVFFFISSHIAEALDGSMLKKFINKLFTTCLGSACV